MLNEFSYCPRLAYLEWVQGEFADNLDTREGRFDHRRVDRPDRQEVPERSGEQGALSGEPGDSPSPEIHSRSLMLSAPGEGLIAKMDLVDLQAGIAIPVDYKHGHVPDVPGHAWEPEQVQLCAQGLILRENGYLCEGGILYYVESRKRVSIPFDEPLVDRTRDLLQELRATAARRVIPPPLVDSPKCPRCSLVGICLPDETHLLQLRDQRAEIRDQRSTPARSASEEDITAERDEYDQARVRRLMPARDDALPLYIKDQGVTLGKSGDELTVKSRQATLQKVKMIDTSQVSIFGAVQVTAQAVRELAAAGIPLCHFSYGGWFNAVTVGMIHKNVELRIAQFAAAADPGRSLALARQFVLGKIKNCRTLLRRHLEESQGREVLDQLSLLMRRAEATADAASLLGIEGMAAKEYFAAFAKP
jgi:CRISPR-associated protein Cas1